MVNLECGMRKERTWGIGQRIDEFGIRKLE
jgi:hypothetical protein